MLTCPVCMGPVNTPTNPACITDHDAVYVECGVCGTLFKYTTTPDGGQLKESLIPMSEDAIKKSKPELQERLHVLNKRQQEVKQAKKTATATYNDELKELEAEIVDTLKLLENM